MSEPDYLGYKLKLKISSHISQATQWNDTRNIYKLPVNQNEINLIKSKLKKLSSDQS